MWGFFGLMFVCFSGVLLWPGGLEFTTFTSLALNSGRPPCSFLCLRVLELKVYTTTPAPLFLLVFVICLFVLLIEKENKRVCKQNI